MLPLWEMVLGWLLTVVIVTGNGLVIYLITTRRNLGTTTNWFVLSLAVADFGVGAFYFPRFSLCAIYQSCHTEVGAIAFSIAFFFVYASVTNLCALTLDRYLAIVKPLRYVTFMTKKRVALFVFVTWGVASLVLISFLVVDLALSGETQEIIEENVPLFFAVLSFSACVFLLFATGRIFLIIRRIARQNAAVVAQLNFNHRIQHRVAFKARETASAKMVGIVVTIFVIYYLLDILDTILSCCGSSFQFSETWVSIFTILILANSAINPVAYAFHKTEIKRELKRLFRCNRQQVLYNNSVTRGEQREQYQLRLRQNRVEQLPGSQNNRQVVIKYQKNRDSPK